MTQGISVRGLASPVANFRLEQFSALRSEQNARATKSETAHDVANPTILQKSRRVHGRHEVSTR